MLSTFHWNALGSTLGWWLGPFGRRLGRFGTPLPFGTVPCKIQLVPKQGVFSAPGGGGGLARGFGTQKFVYQKWPDKIFPIVHFVFSRNGPFCLGGGGYFGGGVPPPLVFHYPKDALPLKLSKKQQHTAHSSIRSV